MDLDDVILAYSLKSDLTGVQYTVGPPQADRKENNFDLFMQDNMLYMCKITHLHAWLQIPCLHT